MTHEQAVEIVARAGWLANEDGHAVLYSDLHRLNQHLVAQTQQLREADEQNIALAARVRLLEEERENWTLGADEVNRLNRKIGELDDQVRLLREALEQIEQGEPYSTAIYQWHREIARAALSRSEDANAT